MTDLRKLLEDARSALYALGEKHYDKIAERIDAALAEPVEPVAWQMPDGDLIANDSADTVGMWRIGGKPLYAAPAEQDRVDAERWRMAKSLAVVRKSGRKLYKTDDPIPSYRLLRDADFGVIKPEINEEYEVCLFACIGETSIPEMDAMMDYAIDRARSAK